MAEFTTENLRTIALVGHSGSGKTSLAEALLVKSGVIATPGSIDKGTTVTDFDPLEKHFKHSLNSSVVHLPHAGARIHLIDTPGFPDFMGPAIAALDAVDTLAIVINAQNGIEHITRRMMNLARKRHLCTMVVIHRIDADNVDLPGLLAAVQEAFGRECLPINLPAARGSKVIDCFFNPAGESDFSSVAAAHSALVDQVVEVDEDLMALYLEQGDAIKPDQLHAPFEKALRDGHLIPVCFASSRTGAGIGELLDIFAKLAPNPTEGNPPLFVKGEGAQAEEFRSAPDRTQHVLAHVFKVVIDPFVGKLGVFRVHQGTITPNSQLFIGASSKSFRAGHLYLLQGKEYKEVIKLVPGDIGAVAKVDDIAFDCVLHDSHDEDRIHLLPLDFPQPMYGLAVEPKRRGDEQRIFEVLHKLEMEDPCFTVERHPTTHETVINGLGELHMRAMLERMARQYNLEVVTQPPKIPYRETVTLKADGHYRHKKQSGGAGQFGEVFLRIEPIARGDGFEFVDDIYGGSIPTQFVPAVEKGVRDVLVTGPLAGFPVHDVRVIVYDGKSHPVDSKEIAFATAGRKAFIDAILKARPMVLEPIVNVEVVVPERAIGDITGDISSRRGHITGTHGLSAGVSAVQAAVPLSELKEYPARLKSMTGGQGSYSIELSHYEPVPPHVQAELARHHKTHAKVEED
ncbi:MAG: elongation factor G [Betaproteobacteria bacterium]|nr:elongation factor G [Betaproteobacteria bacterium]